MRAVLTPDDLKRGELVEVGWHPAEIVRYKEDDAKTDGSTNCTFFFKILDGPAKGIEVKRLFNEKALGFGKSLWAIFFGPPNKETGYTADQLNTQSFESKVGTKVKIYIKRGKSDKGNEFNDVVDFQPLS